MLKPIKFDKASKHKKSKGLRSNVSMHPFVLVAILAALTVVVLAIGLFYFRFVR